MFSVYRQCLPMWLFSLLLLLLLLLFCPRFHVVHRSWTPQGSNGANDLWAKQYDQHDLSDAKSGPGGHRSSLVQEKHGPGRVFLCFFKDGIHPGRLTWNLKMMVWKMIFLLNWAIFRFHVNLPGYTLPETNSLRLKRDDLLLGSCLENFF